MKRDKPVTAPLDLPLLRAILLRDQVWSTYAIADLQPAFAPYCRWSVVANAHGQAALLLFTALQPPILFATGDDAAVAEALAANDWPEQIYVTVRPAHCSLVGEYYTWIEPHSMVRMVLGRDVRFPMPTMPGLVRLQPADAAAIRTLYAHGGSFTPDAFDPYQLDDGVFYGVKDEEGALCAVGGTHIIAWPEAMAAIGNMYTHPAQRGKGYARAVLVAIVTELQTRNVTTIVLNVDERNVAARRLYEQVGFTPYCRYIEAEGIKKNRNCSVHSSHTP
jgi:GNAT superfamily N-acetyltransferase